MQSLEKSSFTFGGPAREAGRLNLGFANSHPIGVRIGVIIERLFIIIKIR